MENTYNDMEQPFWEVLIKSLEKLESKISDLEQKVSTIPNNYPTLLEIKKEFGEVKHFVSRISFPEKDIRNLTSDLRTVRDLFSQSVNKVEHHHHIPKIIFISAGLLLALCLVSMGWFNTYGVLKQYEGNDTKYRFLKVQNNKPLQQLLFITDSLYATQSKMRENVIYQEDSILD